MTEQERIRAALEVRMCPFCGRGPWRLLARHTAVAHGVGARELKNLAGMRFVDSTLDEEGRARRAEVSRRPENVARLKELGGSALGVKHELSDAGKAIVARTGRESAGRGAPRGVVPRPLGRRLTPEEEAAIRADPGTTTEVSVRWRISAYLVRRIRAGGDG